MRDVRSACLRGGYLPADALTNVLSSIASPDECPLNEDTYRNHRDTGRQSISKRHLCRQVLHQRNSHQRLESTSTKHSMEKV